MKKFLAVLTSTLLLSILLSSCGPSAKQLEEPRIADSIRVADSLAMVQAGQQQAADMKESSPGVSNELKNFQQKHRPGNSF